MRILLSVLLCFAALVFYTQTPHVDSAQHYLIKGDSLFDASEYQKALAAFEHALNHAKGDADARVKIFNSLGNTLAYKGDKEGALNYYQQALREAPQSKNPLKAEANILKNISSLYQENGDYPMAFEYMNKAEHAGKKWNDSLFTADLLNNKGLLLEYADSLPQAYDSYMKAYQIFSLLKNEERLALTANNLGVVCKNLGRYNEAIVYYRESLYKARIIQNDFFVAANYNNLGNLYTKLNRYDEAIAHSDSALSIARNIGHLDLVKECLGSLAEHYEAKGDFQNAFLFQKKYQALNDSLLNTERVNAVAELETKFQVEKKDLQLSKVTAEKLLSDESNKRKTLYIILLVLAIAMISGALMVTTRIRKLKQHKRELELVAQTEKQERDRIAQDMHDELGSGISRINWITASAQRAAKNDDEKKNFTHIESIASQLSSGMKSLIWLLNSGNCELDVLAGRIREMAAQHAEEFGYTLTFDANQLPTVTLKQNAVRDIFLMCKECVNNTCKYAHATKLCMTIHANEGHLILQIKDDGNGFDASNTTSGNGLGNLKKRAKAHNGTCEVKSEVSNGTSVEIRLPMSNISMG
ncbi:MAG: tetratricopeptide repeat protein [Flavobacteriales bacterium]